MSQIQVPKGWKLKKIDDICETITSGGTPSRSNSHYFGGKIPWLKIGDLNNGVIFDSEEKLTLKGLENSSAKLFPKNTVLIAMYGATIGKTGILGKECATNQAICGLICKSNLNPNYLHYFLKSKYYEIRKKAEGGAQPNINQGKIRELEILLPPLEIQKRIVQKLDYILGQLEEKKKMILGLFEENSECIKFLHQNIHRLNLYRYFPMKPQVNWKTKKLDEIAEVGQGGTPSTSKSEYWNGNIPWLRSGELLDNVIYDSEFKITKKGLEESSTKLCPKGTIMIAMTGQGLTRGKTALLGIEACANQSCAHIINNRNEVQNDFLWNFLKSRYWFIRGIHHGSGQPGINVSIIKKLEISYPSLDEQKIIVKKIENTKNSVLLEKEKLVEVHKSIQNKITAINSIQVTILDKAFSGKLN